jgi:hypothetical protein
MGAKYVCWHTYMCASTHFICVLAHPFYSALQTCLVPPGMHLRLCHHAWLLVADTLGMLLWCADMAGQ